MTDPRDPRQDDTDRSDATDADVDAQLRAAGERMRNTAPATGDVPSSTNRSRRSWALAAAAVGTAAAVVLALVVLPGDDETLREVPADTTPIEPEATTPEPTTPEPEPTTPDASTPDASLPATTAPEEPEGPDEPALVEVIDQRDWDGRGGRCFTLSGPPVPVESSFCLEGIQIAHGASVHVRGDGYEWHLDAHGDLEGWTHSSAGGGSGTVESDQCGLPLPDQVPADRWTLVSHCEPPSTATLYTLLRDGPDGETSHLVTAVDGSAYDAAVIDVLDVPATADGLPDRLTALEVVGDVRGAPLRCVMMVPESAAGWNEACRFVDDPLTPLVVLHAGRAYELVRAEALDGDRTPLADLGDAAPLFAGCFAPWTELLASVDARPTLVSAVACGIGGDPLQAPVDATLIEPSVLIRSGPIDGLFTQLARDDQGTWDIVDSGTGIDPEPFPLTIMPSTAFTWDPDELPPRRDQSLLDAISTRAALEDLLADAEAFYVAQYPSEGRPPPQLRQPVVTIPMWTADLVLLDDAAGSAQVFLWLVDDVDAFVIDRAIISIRCSRGLTDIGDGFGCV